MGDLLGKRVVDTVTRASGTVVAQAVYLKGAERAAVAFLGADGVPREEWFDRDRLERID